MMGGGGEKLSDSILKLEDLIAQCNNEDETAIFKYVKSLKRLEWYRSEYFSEIEEDKVRTLAFGIVRKSTGKPDLPEYRDIRDIPIEADFKNTNPYAFSRTNFREIYWHQDAKPTYSTKDCKKHAKKWRDLISTLEKKMPDTFPEVKKYLEMADPSEFLRIAKKIGSCSKYGSKGKRHFIDETSFEAWISNSISQPSGKNVIVSRPILDQLKRELRALGAMANAAEKIVFDSFSESDCSTLDTAIYSYQSKHRSL